MHYHGLTLMPDGQPVTPKTLNEWLRSEKDGYVFGGNVNWPAISRLTKKISERYQTAKLEYRRVISPQITDIQKEITSKRPAIGEIPGHFVVVKGITGNEHDYYIHDPLFPYTTLKPHDTNLISLRTLTPSQTDLSYLIIYSHPATEVLLINKDTDQIIPAEQFLEHLSDLSGESTESSPIIKVTQVAKPSFGRYQIVVFQTELAPLQLTIFNYNPEGEFAEFSYAGVYGNQPLFIETSVGSSTPQISSPDMTLPLLKEKLTHLFYQGKISRLASYSKLSQILSWAEAASNDTHKQQRYFSLFVYTLQLLDGTLDPDVYLLLKDQSLALKQLLSPD